MTGLDQAASQNDAGLKALGLLQPVQAEHHFLKAYRASPDQRGILVNLGLSYAQQGDFDRAARCYIAASAQQNCRHNAMKNLGFLRVWQGKPLEGWTLHNERFADPAVQRRHWRGTGDPTHSLMIWNDVGQGDALQFCRYLPALERQGITVTLAVQPELIPLFKQLGPIRDRVISRDGQPWRQAERHLPLMGLPLAVDPELQVGPHDLKPYFQLPPEQQSCPEALLRLPGGRRIGLCWASNPGDTSLYPIKSMPLNHLLETTWRADDQLISLQRGEHISKEKHREHLAAVLPETADWVETARWINHCDLVITVDTAVAHLAGGLGRPVVVLLPWLPDWRWNYGEQGRQWYRCCWTVRQPERGDWQGAVARLGACIDEAIRFGSSATPANG